MHYRNLAELQRRQAERLGPLPALRYKKHGLYHNVSWQEYHGDSLACAAALVDSGVAPGHRVGLLSENRVEWLVSDLGAFAAAAMNVPLHAPLSARQIQFQLADAGVCWLFVSTRSQLEKVVQVRADLPALRGIVVFDGAEATGTQHSTLSSVIPWPAFLQRGRQLLAQLRPELARRESALGRDDLATVMYTSGTTGNPKGVMLTHGNLLSNACAMLEAGPMAPDSVVLNWLPLSHIYARTVDHYMSMVAGVVLCLAESPETVLDNAQELNPTHMSSVPRLYEKALAACASADTAETGRKLAKRFGARIEWLGSGGAPLPVPVAQAFHAAGLHVLQGYGLTECAPVIAFNRKTNNKIGTVGQAIPGVEVAIAPDGEVLTRGPHVMKGYWNNPEASSEALAEPITPTPLPSSGERGRGEGRWLHTGDLGRLDEEGFLSITGRKKELLVLSNGKKVVPSYIEGLLIADPCIDQAAVCGEGRNFLTALIVPHWSNVRRVLRESGIAGDSESEEVLAEHAVVRSLLQSRIDAVLAEVATWERVRKIKVLSRPFSVAADELTVSLKLRRAVVIANHKAELEGLYCNAEQGLY